MPAGPDPVAAAMWVAVWKADRGQSQTLRDWLQRHAAHPLATTASQALHAAEHGTDVTTAIRPHDVVTAKANAPAPGDATPADPAATPTPTEPSDPAPVTLATPFSPFIGTWRHDGVPGKPDPAMQYVVTATTLAMQLLDFEGHVDREIGPLPIVVDSVDGSVALLTFSEPGGQSVQVKLELDAAQQEMTFAPVDQPERGMTFRKVR